MLVWGLTGSRNHIVVFMTSVSVTNRTDTRHSGFPVSRQTAAASLGLCVWWRGRGWTYGKTSQNRGIFTLSTPCLSPSIVSEI